MILDTRNVSLAFKTIAVVDDNAEFCLLLKRFLEAKGYDISVFSSSADFINKSCTAFDLVLLDLYMPDPDGVAVIRHLASVDYGGAVLLMSGEDQGVLRAAMELAKAQRLEKIAAINKPFPLENLSLLVHALLQTVVFKAQANTGEWQPVAEDVFAAIELQQLQLYYQPKIVLADNTLAGFEALLRWHHPEHGLVMPDNFIPLAEQSTELMQLLTDEVVRLAILQLTEWHRQGQQVQLSINLSMLNLEALDFPEQLEQKLRAAQLSPGQLLLEITESALMSDVASALDILLRLRMKGFGLSIDDFGTGYSSLSQLHRIPFSELKVDRSFVMTMLQSHESRTIVETCIQLAKRLGLQVVAEGVESQAILAQLLVMGCDIGQGYFWSKPILAKDTQAWLLRQ
ncbi:EAL domain-containing response regulator [Rheinheimera baltica]|uniref:EAL domain-containing response regulator n=1 Tax=Rheinheimera baltica TaxID=67576 RepID=A0ABT9I3D9_9GAMM|nr:EAL domain-containing response regulator [Rheinheimera baltica]MDP5137907.1 EAL domain-containing response regulator [Rheinheimera baltica]